MTKRNVTSSQYTRRHVLRGTLGLSSLAAANALGVRGAFGQEPAKPAEIVVRSWGGGWLKALKAGVSDSFTAQTGIPVRHDLTSHIEIQPKIAAAVAQKRLPPVHVNWDATTNATKSALQGLTEDLSDLSNLSGVTDRAKPFGLDGYPIINTYGYVMVLAYRTSVFPEGPPKSWHVLLDPRVKGRIGLYKDSSGLYFPAQIAGGGKVEDIPGNMQPAWDFIAKLKQQRPLLGSDTDFTTWFQNGEIDIACTISSNAREARKNGIDIKWTVPVEGAKYDTDCLWVPKGLPPSERYWARQYVNHAITKQAQQVWLGELGFPGVVPGLVPPADLVGDRAYPTTEADFANLIRVSSKIQVEHAGEWFAKFKSIMES